MFHSKQKEQTIFVMTDTCTRYTEAALIKISNKDDTCRAIQHRWVSKHDVPDAVSGDDVHRKPMLRWLDIHHVCFEPRPARRHNKTGFVERKIHTLKIILRKLQIENCDDDPCELVTRAAFLSKVFVRNNVVCSFQLVRGYQPSIVRIPPEVMAQELLNTHVLQVAIRAFQTVLHENTSTKLDSSMISKDDKVWVRYSLLKGNEQDEWFPARLVEKL